MRTAQLKSQSLEIYFRSREDRSPVRINHAKEAFDPGLTMTLTNGSMSTEMNKTHLFTEDFKAGL